MAGRLPRHVIPGGLHEVTFRCHQARPLLRPSEKVNAIIKGCLAKAQQATGLEIVWVVVMSNHAHALVRPESPSQLADFLCHFKTNLSKEIGRMHRYSGGIFAGTRADVAPITDEPEAQVARLLYLLSQGVKEVSPPRFRGHPIRRDNAPRRCSWERDDVASARSSSET